MEIGGGEVVERERERKQEKTVCVRNCEECVLSVSAAWGILKRIWPSCFLSHKHTYCVTLSATPSILYL